jgi:chemotaxis protein MotB
MQSNSRRLSQRNHRAALVHSHVVLLAGAIVLAAAASTACVSTGRYYQIEQEREALAQKNKALQSEADSATQEKSALEAKLAHLEAQESTLNAKLKDSEEDAAKLQATYDGLIQSLQKELKSGQVEVTQLRDGLRVNVAQDILFDSGSAALDKNGTIVLTKVATQLKKQSGHQILVIGHTDNKPIRPTLAKQYPSNWELAGARASSVVRLFSKSGLSSKRMNAISVADSQPVASNKTEEGRAKNRRIEIRLRPITPEDKNS